MMPQPDLKPEAIPSLDWIHVNTDPLMSKLIRSLGALNCPFWPFSSACGAE
jgi:hypothetical protein